MHLTLVVPDLLPDREFAAQAFAGQRLPGAEALFARGAPVAVAAASGLTAWLCDAFAVPREPDWPLAALTLAADGGEPGTHAWLRADPVHLALRKGRFHVVDARLLDVSRQEAEELAAAFNRHFAAADLMLFPMDPARWYVRTPSLPAIITTPPDQAASRRADEYLPRGEDALRWIALMNEVQMLFQAQPVNEAREARGLLALNSLWFWGAGSLPALRASPFDHVFCDDHACRALGVATGARVAPLHGGAAQWLLDAGAGRHLMVLDALAGPASYGDMVSWREVVTTLEHEWFAPLFRALAGGRMRQLDLVVTGAAPRRLTLRPRDCWRVWRRRRNLAHFAV